MTKIHHFVYLGYCPDNNPKYQNSVISRLNKVVETIYKDETICLPLKN